MAWKRHSLVALVAALLGGAAIPHAQDDVAPEIAAARAQYERQNAAAIAVAREACVRRGGAFGHRGLSIMPFCTVRLSDAGKACRSAADCSGECISPTTDLRRGTPVAGQCTALMPHLGCYTPVQDGRARQPICAD